MFRKIEASRRRIAAQEVKGGKEVHRNYTDGLGIHRWPCYRTNKGKQILRRAILETKEKRQTASNRAPRSPTPPNQNEHKHHKAKNQYDHRLVSTLRAGEGKGRSTKERHLLRQEE